MTIGGETPSHFIALMHQQKTHRRVECVEISDLGLDEFFRRRKKGAYYEGYPTTMADIAKMRPL